MEIMSPPSKISRISGKSGCGQDNCTEHEEGVANGLNYGRSGGFTLMQMQELQQQTLIYTYMEAGIPIPSHLIMPIWKCVTSSLSICQLNPNVMGFGPSYATGLELEPGRCRRTDGKKWRCSKGVITGHKYCQRHMHRNRQISRKHAETLTNSNTKRRHQVLQEKNICRSGENSTASSQEGNAC